jgi:hypothetical protein
MVDRKTILEYNLAEKILKEDNTGEISRPTDEEDQQELIEKKL